MTNAELQEKLAKFPPEMLVVVMSYHECTDNAFSNDADDLQDHPIIAVHDGFQLSEGGKFISIEAPRNFCSEATSNPPKPIGFERNAGEE